MSEAPLTKGESKALASIVSAKRLKPERVGIDNLGVTQVVSVWRGNPEYRYIKRLAAKGKLIVWQYRERIYEPGHSRPSYFNWFEVALPEWNPNHRPLKED